MEIDDIINGLVNEAVRSRLRNRALLDVLARDASLEMRAYIEAYRREEEENFEPVLAMLVTEPAKFRERFSEWLAKERSRFGYFSEVYPAAQLAREPEADGVSDAAAPTLPMELSRRPPGKKKKKP